MATKSFELTRLDPDTFEHMVNALALRVLGAGHTGFGPGSDGGRDGLFEGRANYPSEADQWSGTWYIQSKFHSPHLSSDPQKWLQKAVQSEIARFAEAGSDRTWPDNWIIATNIDPSAAPAVGTTDVVRRMVTNARAKMAARVHIWGGEKILQLLGRYPDVARYYGAFLTSGQVISAVIDSITDQSASVSSVIRNLTATQFHDQQFTKLEQAGSASDNRPGIHRLFTDLPYIFDGLRVEENALRTLTKAAAETHLVRSSESDSITIEKWRRRPERSRVWFIRGGPGQGKSTVTQYLSQIHRAAAILDNRDSMPVLTKLLDVAKELEGTAMANGFWPSAARIPVTIELRVYAHWYGNIAEGDPTGILSYLAHDLTKRTEQTVLVGTLKRALSAGRWLFVFDGLDEVPGDVKDGVANEVVNFVENILAETGSDAFVACTSRPQGYAGQFDRLSPCVVDLDMLTPAEALNCARPVLEIDRSAEEIASYNAILEQAINSPAVREIMTTPLQSHIMAVVVRDGGRPPERKWALFSNFYQIIKRRESNRNFMDPAVSRLLREGDSLIKALHNRLGFELHYRAERSSGAQTSLSKPELRQIVSEIVNDLLENDIEETIETLMAATTERLVLVSTPENGNYVRFDIRPLQEFFAAEYLYESAPSGGIIDRLRIIAPDSHWREVFHFLMSALIELGRRDELDQAIQVISDIDDPPQDQDRSFARRLAIGGVISSRLLREGVAEADKKIRHKFKPCLSALMSSTDAIDVVYSLRTPQTRIWMSNLILSTLEEQSPAENIGACCLAAIIIDGVDDDEIRILDYLGRQEVDYKSTFIKKVISDFYIHRERWVPVWVVRFLIRELLKPSWYKLPMNARQAAYDCLSGSAEKTRTAAGLEGLSPFLTNIFLSVFLNREERQKEKNEAVETHLGIISEKIYPGPKILKAEQWNRNQIGEISSTAGLLNLICMVAVASASGGREDIVALWKIIAEHPEQIEKAPLLLQDLFFNHSFHISDIDSLESALKKSLRCKRSDRAFIGDADAKGDWPGLLREYPHVIPAHIGREYKMFDIDDLEMWLKSEDGESIFIAAVLCKEKPITIAFGDWVRLRGRLPRIASAIRNHVASSPVNVNERYSSSDKIEFSPNLPIDADLLPHLVVHLNGYYTHRSGIGFGEQKKDSHYRSFVVDIFPASSMLEATLADISLPAVIRASAGVLLLAHRAVGNGDGLSRLLDDILECYQEDMGCWLLPSAFLLLGDLIRQENNVALSFVDRCLRLTRENFQARLALEKVVADWREISRSPVSSSLSLSIWI